MRDKLPPEVQLRRLAGSLGTDLYKAVRYYETFVPSTSRSLLMDRVNKARIHGGLMAISDALYESAALALARLWDTHPRAATFTVVAKRMKLKSDRGALEASTGIVIANTDLEKWHREIEVVQSSPQLAFVRGARNRDLAHSENPNLDGDNTHIRWALYEHDVWVLDRSVAIFDQFNAWVGFGTRDGSFSIIRKRACEDAARFWEHVAVAGP